VLESWEVPLGGRWIIRKGRVRSVVEHLETRHAPLIGWTVVRGAIIYRQGDELGEQLSNFGKGEPGFSRAVTKVEGERAKGVVQNGCRMHHLWDLGGDEASVANGYGKGRDSACSWGGEEIYEGDEVSTLRRVVYVI